MPSFRRLSLLYPWIFYISDYAYIGLLTKTVRIGMELNHLVGALSGLTAALVWTVASFLFRRLGHVWSPNALNLLKGLIAFGLIALILSAEGWVLPGRAPALALAVSGIVGIALGDNLFFGALNRIQVQRTLIIAQNGAPLFTVVLAWLFLGEQLSWTAYTALLIVLSGITLSILADGFERLKHDRTYRLGLLMAFSAALLQAVGAVLTRHAFSLADVGVFMATEIRLGAALVFLLLFQLFPNRGKRMVYRTGERKWLLLLTASVIGALGGLTFQQAAFKYTFASIAQTLIASSSLMGMLFMLLRGSRPKPLAWVGVGLALAGIMLLFSVI